MVCLRAGKLSNLKRQGGACCLFLSRGYYGILWRGNEGINFPLSYIIRQGGMNDE
jgi:hypothetical protein